MASTLGDAVVGITADTSQLQSQLAKTFRSTPILGALDSFGGTITKVVGGAITAAAVGAGAVAAKGLWGGMKRALDREDAIITFRRLGLDQKNIKQMIDSIDKALSGTPITNPEGFALAGRFLAQGFAEADIPGIVGTLADMAAVGNRSFDEMADVMVRAAGQGKITARELMRMGDIPLGRIAKEMGLTEAELRKITQEGKLTAEAFIDAFAAVEEFNGAAKDPTTRTAWKNFWTSISRAGEAFLGPFLGEGGFAQTSLLRMRQMVDALIPSFNQWGQAIATQLIPRFEQLSDILYENLLPALDQVKEAFQTGVDLYRENETEIRKILDAVTPAAAAIAGLGVSVHLLGVAFRVLLAASPVGLLVGAATAFTYLYQNSKPFRDTVDNLVGLLTDLWDAFDGAAVLETVAGWIETATTTLTGLFNQIRGFDWGQATSETTSGLAEMGANFQLGLATIGGIVSRAWANIAARFDTAEWAARFANMWDSIVTIFTISAETIDRIWDVLWKGIRGAWDTFADPIIQVIVNWVDTFTRIIEAFLGSMAGVFEATFGLITLDADKFKSGITRIFQSLFGAVSAVVTGALNTVRTIINAILTTIDRDWREKWDKIVDFVVKLPGRLVAALSGLAGVLVGPFKSAFNTIANAWNATLGNFSLKIPDIIGVPGRGTTIEFPRMPTFAEGGPVTQTGPIFAHQGEHVLTADLTRRLDRFLTRPQAVSVGNIEIVLPAGTDRREAEEIARVTVDAALGRLAAAVGVA